MDFLYRIEPVYYDESNNVHSNICYKYSIIKQTSQGKWIDVFGTKKFVLDNSKKCYAHQTIELAYESFIYRRKKHGMYLQSRLERNDLIIKKSSFESIVKVLSGSYDGSTN